MTGVIAVLATLTAYSMVTHDGRRLVSHREGTNEVFELVATNALPKDLPAVRPWRIYGIKATHTDIGLHNSQYVQRQGSVARLEQAMRLVDADTRADDDPAAYRYVVEGMWFWENYVADRGEDAARAVVSNYVRRGRIDIGCTCAGNHTHVFGPQELQRSTLTKRRLAEKWGVGSRTMLMIDNPGLSWSIVKPYAAAGIRNVVFAPNQWNPLPSTIWPRDPSVPGGTWNPDAGGGGSYIDVRWNSKRPMVFWWESPDASERLLVWSSTQYDKGLCRFGIYPFWEEPGTSEAERERMTARQLAAMEARYPFDVWLAANYGDDEFANAWYADYCAKWNAKWAVPTFCTVGDLDAPFERLARLWGDRIETVRGEMTSGWLTHVASTPELLSDKLEAERKLVAAEERWRADPRRDRASAKAIDRAWWELICHDEHSYGTSGYQGRRVFETWMQHRDWIEKVDATATDVLARYGVRAQDPLANDGVPVTDEAENDWYRVRVNAKGEIVSIYDKELGRELLSAPANRLLYTRDNHRTWCDESLLGAKITRRVYLARNEKRIDVVDRFEHARDLFNDCRYYRYGYLAFPFAVPGGTFRAALGGGEVIDPYRDQSGYATDAYVAARDWCAVENGDFGVALFQRDTLLTEFGEIHPDKTCFTGVAPEGGSAVYPFLFADWLQMHQPDGDSISFTLRYAITSYRGDWRQADIPRRADAYVNPYRPVAGAPASSRGAFPEQAASDPWTGLIDAPRAGHGEDDGQMYLLWGAETDPAFDRYELYRDGAFVANVTNEVHDGVPFRVARHVDTGLGSHRRYEYALRKVWKDGAKGPLSAPFRGLTRFVSESERTRVVCNSEVGRQTTRYVGCQLESFVGEKTGGEVFYMQERPVPGKEIHGGVPICWPWFARASKAGLPKHGLARYLRWRLVQRISKTGVEMECTSTPETLRLWPHEFRLSATVEIVDERSVRVAFTEENTGAEPFEAAWGFHPYFAVAESQEVAVDGRRRAPEAPDDIFKADGRPHRLEDLAGGRTFEVTCSDNEEWVVWNPGVGRTPVCETLGPDEWKRFHCLEPCTRTPRELKPGERRTHVLTVTVSAP